MRAGPRDADAGKLDGKKIRRTKDADGNQVRLLAASVGPDAASVIDAQAEVSQ